jgi:multidrug efflux pump
VFARFFIDRPILAAVPSIIITLAGLVAVMTLPIAQYPEITPPTVQVSCAYPGASAAVVADTVAAPIEQQVNGVENMLYMSSNSASDGSYSLTVTFALGTDLDMAQVLVQNRVAAAQPLLPDVVKQTGVSTRKKSPSILLVVNLLSPGGTHDQLFMSNYATIRIRDELARLKGVGDVAFLGQQDYSMRVWLDPDRLAARGLTAGDVVQAVREQNVQVAAGQIGQPPVPAGQDFQYTMSTLGRLSEPEEFGDIIVKTGAAGALTRLRDIARIELSAKSQDQSCTLDGQPSTGLAIFQAPGSNALATAAGVRERMEQLKADFPEDLDYAIVYDTTPFVRESVHEVFNALRDAIILVAVVVLLFLQSWRATLIPLIAVPVAIVGTFAVMVLFGFSLNNISLLALVLAIGIVVDDAIVVVEAVEHHIEHGRPPREAAYAAMQEVSGPIIAISLVLASVFIPSAFLPGITGQFFRQFALTIAVSTVFSAINSLTLSPALAALLLQPRGTRRDPLAFLLNLALGWLFRLFNGGFNLATSAYRGVVARLLRVSAVVLVVYAGLLYLTYWGFLQVPGGFIPTQDKGYLLVNVQLPDAAALERTQDVMRRVDDLLRETHGVGHTVGISGQSFVLGANGPNCGSLFVVLEDFEHRHDPALHAERLAGRLRQHLGREIQDAAIGVFGAPPVDGLGNAGGFKLMLQDRGDQGLPALQAQAEHLAERMRQVPGYALFTMFRASTPQLFVDIDRAKAKTLGVPLADVFDTLQVFLGSKYVNDFNRFGRTWQVILQAEAAFRARPEDVARLQVRNARGGMVPLGTLADVREISGPVMINRYNMYPAAAVNGATAPGISSGTAIATVADLADRELAPGFGFEWTEITLLQLLAGSTALLAFAGAAVLVFLLLAAQYESWLLPLAVILVVPMCILCALGGVAWTGRDIDIFTQIGFVVLVGLASKNAILIVEFARARQAAGAARREATLEACTLRLRPIMMTSLAFILGVVPLVIAAGAGAEMRRALGVAVFSGMIGVTLFGIFLTPVFYYVVTAFTRRPPEPAPPASPPSAAPPRQ